MLKTAAPARGEVDAPGAEAARSPDWTLNVLRALLHEMSQPLTALQGELDLALAADPGRDSWRAVLQACWAETDRLSELVRRARELAELEWCPHPRGEVRVAGVARLAVESLSPVGASHGVGIRLVVDREATVTAVPEALERTVCKLVERAIARSPKGGQIRVAVGVSGASATLEVADEGPSPALPDSQRGIDAPGSGFEWAYAKRFAERSGGALRIEKAHGRGCVVRLSLPLFPEMNP